MITAAIFPTGKLDDQTVDQVVTTGAGPGLVACNAMTGTSSASHSSSRSIPTGWAKFGCVTKDTNAMRRLIACYRALCAPGATCAASITCPSGLDQGRPLRKHHASNRTHRARRHRQRHHIADFLVETHGFVKLKACRSDQGRHQGHARHRPRRHCQPRQQRSEARLAGLLTAPRHADTSGTDWGREMIHPDIWLRITARRTQKIMAMPDTHHIQGIVISDVPENEADWIAPWAAASGISSASNAASMAPPATSEQAIPRHAADRIINNDGAPEDTFEFVCELIDLIEAEA